MSERETFLLGGRAFARAEDTTVEQDLWIMGTLRRVGLDQLSLEVGETADDFAHRLLSDLAASGKALPLLGALIVPADGPETWSEELAASTAAFLATLKAPDDKARVNTLIVSMLLGFFLSGIVSLHEFKRSLDESIATDPASEMPATSDGSGSGPKPSEQSQDAALISSGV